MLCGVGVWEEKAVVGQSARDGGAGRSDHPATPEPSPAGNPTATATSPVKDPTGLVVVGEIAQSKAGWALFWTALGGALAFAVLL